MDPGLEGVIEELLPVRSDLKDQRSTKKEMFIAKTSGHATEIEQISAQRQKHCCKVLKPWINAV